MTSNDHAKPEVSVVVPTRNGERRLPLLLDALERQTVSPHRFEILIIDDGSEDGTRELVEASAIATLVTAPEHLGRAGASNLGLRRAGAEVIAFTDDDTVPAPDWIERGLSAMAAGDAELVAGRIDLALDGEPSIAALVDLGRGYLDQEAMVEEGYAATANLWARRDVIDRIGHFREIWSGGDQDRDLVERAIAAGARLRYAADIVVTHPPRFTVRELARKEFRLAYGAAELRRFSVGPLRGQRQVWTRPRLYLPWRHRSSWARLERSGYRVGGLDRLRMRVVQYCCLQLVQAAGSLLGAWQSRSREV